MNLDAKVLAESTEARLCSAVMWGANMDGLDVTADMFGRDPCRIVWETLVGCWPEVSPPQVADALHMAGRLDHVGGIESFWTIANAASGPHEARELALDLADWAFRRELVARARRVEAAASDRSRDPASLLDDLADVEAPSRSRLTVWSGDEIADVPEPAWLVDGHMQAGLSVVFGPWGSGKSFVAASLASAVASGAGWFGTGCVAGPVLYLSLEGAGGLAQRLQAAGPLDGLHLVGDPVNLGRERDVSDVDGAVRETGARLLVVDTWARATAGQDENDNAGVGQSVEALDRIRTRRGCSVVVVHHSRKGDDGDPRGAGSLPGAADSIWQVTQDQTGTVSVRSTKQKDGMGFRSRQFRIVPHGKSARLEELTRQADLDRDVEAVLGMLADGPVVRGVVMARGGDVLDRLRRMPGVSEFHDDQGRPMLKMDRAPV